MIVMMMKTKLMVMFFDFFNDEDNYNDDNVNVDKDSDGNVAWHAQIIFKRTEILLEHQNNSANVIMLKSLSLRHNFCEDQT